MADSGTPKNNMPRAWLTLVLAGLLIMLFPAVQQSVPYLAQNTKSYHVFGLFKANQPQQPVALKDSSILADTMATYTVDSAYLNSIAQANKLTGIDSLNNKALQPFYEALAAMTDGDKKRLRILWFGDSMVEGDLITQDVRDTLQKKFGGKGVGYAPITSIVWGFRRTVKLRFSDNWHHYNQVSDTTQAQFPVSWNAEYFTAQVDTTDSLQQHQLLTVTYKPGYRYAGTSVLPNPVLLYGPRQHDSTMVDTMNYVIVNNDTLPLDGTRMLNSLSLGSGNYTKVELSFLLKPDQPIYGISFQSNKGVIVDNFASRGNAGMAVATVDKAMYSAYADELGADLIVLQYGVNAVTLGVSEYDWYGRAMIRAVAYLKQSLPNTSILIVSTADRASKQEGVMKTDSSVYGMNKALEEVARNTGSAYFDLYKAMGGQGSMVKWVEADTALANDDYTHFNARGSKKVAGLFVEFLLKEYKRFEEDENAMDAEHQSGAGSDECL